MELVTGRPQDKRIDKEERVYDLLDQLNIDYQRLDHQEANTMEVCLEIEKNLKSTICKNLFLVNSNKSQYYLLMLKGHKKFKTKVISKQINSSRLSFGSDEKMLEYLDITPGSVSLLGLMNAHDFEILKRKFDKFAEVLDKDSCWLWKGYKDIDGYGQLAHSLSPSYSQKAHRVSWILHVGEIPTGMLVCHKCDNPSCVNPHHLLGGTHKDNTRDMFERGREVICRGEKNGSDKLTQNQAQKYDIDGNKYVEANKDENAYLELDEILQDSDFDGYSSSALLYTYLKRIKSNINSIIY